MFARLALLEWKISMVSVETAPITASHVKKDTVLNALMDMKLILKAIVL